VCVTVVVSRAVTTCVAVTVRVSDGPVTVTGCVTTLVVVGPATTRSGPGRRIVSVSGGDADGTVTVLVAPPRVTVVVNGAATLGPGAGFGVTFTTVCVVPLWVITVVVTLEPAE
jgi:hypothetical protein